MLQIYFDFSGYSDMAIGLGRILGFRFLENFNYPYIARSVRDFWRRWHISLTTWLRDYLYIPLGGNRGSTARTYSNLVIVFLLCGLWHGAQWTFVVWGLYHGLFLVIERTGFGKWLKAGRAPVGHLYTLAVVTFGWALFRAETLSQAGAFVSAMFGFAPGTGQEHSVAMYVNTEVILAIAAGVLFSAPVMRYLAGVREKYVTSRTGSIPAAAEGLLCFLGVILNLFIVLVSASYLAAGTYNPFIYFRF
jgi:alginate O-acetyltransferase complex protein AlgI